MSEGNANSRPRVRVDMHTHWTAGSDGHRASEIGRAFSELPDFATSQELLVSLRAGAVRHRLTHPAVRLLRRYTARDVLRRSV